MRCNVIKYGLMCILVSRHGFAYKYVPHVMSEKCINTYITQLVITYDSLLKNILLCRLIESRRICTRNKPMPNKT